MRFFSAFSERRKEPEIIDQPGLETGPHRSALRGLARINFLSGSARILWPALFRLSKQMKGRPLRLLDIATGGGDVPIRLCRRAQRAGVPLHVTGVDVSPTAIAHARAEANRRGASVEFFELDALRAPLPGDYDIITTSLFLHHLELDQATDLLRSMSAAARALVLVNDLVRSAPGYWLAWLGTRVLSGSPIVHADGPRSVAGAFTIAEARQLAAAAGLTGATVSWRWPFRFLLEWRHTP